MSKKIIKSLTQNIGFKLMALAFAIILWLIVYNINDPESKKYFTIAVNVQNQEAVTNLNKCYQIAEGSNSVTFMVVAKRSVMNELTATNFSAVADMARMTMNESETEGEIPIEISVNKNSVRIDSATKYFKVKLETLMSKQLSVKAESKGIVADGFALGNVYVNNPSVIKVSGPASTVERVSEVVATIDVSGMTMDMNDNVRPELLDKNGKKIDATRLTLSNDTINVVATILNKKTVGFKLATNGTVAENYHVVSITAEPKEIEIMGSPEDLNEITSVTIPSSALNVAGATGNITTTVDLRQYLPEGVDVVSPEYATVKITVQIESNSATSYNLSASNIAINGLADGLEAKISTSNVSVKISGTDGDVAELSNITLKGSINLSGLSVGTHTVPVTVDVDNTKYKVSTVQVTVDIVAKSGSSDEGTSNGTAGAGNIPGGTAGNTRSTGQ